MADVNYQRLLEAIKEADAAGNVEEAQKLAELAKKYAPAREPVDDGEDPLIIDAWDTVRNRASKLIEGGARGVGHVSRSIAEATGGEVTPQGQSYTDRFAEHLKSVREENFPDEEGWNLFGKGGLWQNFKENPNPATLAEFAFKTGIASSPDIAAVAANFPVYMWARFGELLEDRLKADNKDKPELEDYAAAAATAGITAALERVGAKGIVDDVFGAGLKQGSKNVAKATVKESGTEFLQEGTEDIGTTVGTETGFDPNRALDRAFAGAVAGGGYGGGARAIGEVTGAVEGQQLPKEYKLNTEEERELANLLEKAADYDLEALKNLDDSDRSGARGVANAALIALHEERKLIVNDLRKLASKLPDPRLSRHAVNTLNRVDNLGTSNVPMSYVNDLKQVFGETEDTKRFESLSKMTMQVKQFVAPGGTRGGISKMTRIFDPFEKQSMMLRSIALLSGGATAGKSLIAGVALNRAARGFDNLTGRRWAVHRYVKKNRGPLDRPTGMAQSLLHQQAQAVQQVASRRRVQELAAKMPGPWSGKDVKLPDGTVVNTGRIRPQKPATKADAKQTQKLAEEAKRKADMRAEIEGQRALTEQMFQDNVIPDHPYYNPYRMWKKYTGFDPADILTILEQLHAGGHPVVKAEDIERFRSNIHSFSTKRKEGSHTYNLQVAVWEAGGKPPLEAETGQESGHEDGVTVALSRSQSKKRGKKQQGSGDPYSGEPKNRNWKNKAARGWQRYDELLQQIRNDPNLTEAEKLALTEIADKINDREFTVEDRRQIVDEEVGEVIGNKKKAALWKVRFGYLASAGNNFSIDTFADGASQTTEEEVTAQQDFKERAKQAKAKAKKSKKDAKKRPPDDPSGDQGGPDTPTPPAPLPPSSPAGKPKDDTIPPSSETDQRAKKEPQPWGPPLDPSQVKDPQSKRLVESAGKKEDRASNRNSLDTRLGVEFSAFFEAEEIAQQKGQELEAHKQFLSRQATPEAVVELLMLEDPGFITQNSLTEAYAKRAKIDRQHAAAVVDNALRQMEAAGRIKRFTRGKNSVMTQEGRPVPTTDEADVYSIHVEAVEGTDIAGALNVAKAVEKIAKLPLGVAPPPYTLYQLEQGRFSAVPDLVQSDDDVDVTLMPVLDFLNDLRSSPMRVETRILDAIEEAVTNGAADSRIGEVGKQMVKKTVNGKDESNLKAAAQLLFQIKKNGPLLFQEWFAGRNGRVYSLNSSAGSQGGDLMKAIYRLPYKAKPTREGVNWLFHSFGNLLGFDAEAPSARRQAIHKGDTIEQLLKFAQGPFKRNVLERDGKNTRIGDLVNNSEGFFQTLNVALEINDMVAFAAARHPQHGVKVKDGKIDPKTYKKAKALLADEAVLADLGENYKTDFFVQLDAKNNAFQLVGFMTGDKPMLRATGFLPPEGTNEPADIRDPADVYMGPMRAIAERIPELKFLSDMGPDGWKKLRKIGKKPIFTYIYASSSQTRAAGMEQELATQAEKAGFMKTVVEQVPARDRSGKPKVDANGNPVMKTKRTKRAEIFGITPEDGYITIPESFSRPLLNGEPVETFKQSYDDGGFAEGDPKPVIRQLIPTDDGKFQIATIDGSKTTVGKRKYSKEDAVKEAFGRDFYGRMNRELAREINSRFPKIASFMSFTQTVEHIMKKKGEKGIKVPTPDGLIMEYKFKDNSVFEAFPVNLQEGRPSIRMGLRTDQSKIGGRGLAAFLAHMHDAHALRETHRRLKMEGDLVGFNPIHDSYGFHPADATRGQEMFIKVMQEIGNPSYNIFEKVLEANGLTIQDFQAATKRPFIQREGVPPVPPREIPTALS